MHHALKHDTRALLGQLDAAVDVLSGLQPSDATPRAVTEVVAALHLAGDRLAAIKTRWVGHAATVEAHRTAGARSADEWLRGELRVSRREAHQELATASLLEDAPALAEAAATGEVGATALRQIASSVNALPSSADRDAATADLTEVARYGDADDVRRRGRALRIAADQEAATRDAARMWHERRLRLSRDESGAVDINGKLDPSVGEEVCSALHAIASHEAAGDERSLDQRLADALGELTRRSGVGGAEVDVAAEAGATDPRRSGPVHLPRTLLRVDLATLRREPGSPAAELLGVGPIATETARRLCCDSRVVPTICNGDWQPTDVGRESYVVPRAIRNALYLRDVGCRRCGVRKPGLHAHHIIHWADGGETNLPNLLLLCTRCHVAVHDLEEEVELLADATATFTQAAGRVRVRPPP